MQRLDTYMVEGEARLIDGNVALYCCGVFCTICAERFLCYWVEFSICVEMKIGNPDINTR